MTIKDRLNDMNKKTTQQLNHSDIQFLRDLVQAYRNCLTHVDVKCEGELVSPKEFNDSLESELFRIQAKQKGGKNEVAE